MIRITLLSILLFSLLKTQAQTYTIRGKIVDQQGQVIPFASIYIADTKQGTSANSEGKFHLDLPAGEYHLTASALAYRPNTQTIMLNQSTQLTISLENEVYTLDEVIIGNQEDPAYAIIRQAIKARPGHLHESGPYEAQVYIKGLQRMLKAPKNFLGISLDEIADEMGLDSNRRGIIYLSESQSNITVNPPKDFKEEMISSKMSGDNRAFSFNRAADLQFNLYENFHPIVEELSNRPFVSPIADHAFRYYRYQFLGKSVENGITINKIKVIPKRKAEPLYQGNLYITEGTWRIYSLDLLVDKSSGINFVDTLTIKQLFHPVDDDCWMPGNVQMDFSAGLLGFRIAGYFTAIYENYNRRPTVDKRQFRESLKIVEGVNKKDSSYWANNRPIPLTMEEQQDYLRKDSPQKRRESKAYLDSLDRKNNRFRPLSFLTGGYGYRNRYRHTYFRMGSPVGALLFNSVEGLALNYPISFTKQLDSAYNRYLWLNGNIRYGFANRHLNGNLSANFNSNNQQFYLAGGRTVLDLNNRGAVTPLLNSLYTLFLGENYLKLYEKTFATVRWAYTLPGNIQLSAGAEWAKRHALTNATAYTFWDRNRHKLTSNNPFSPDQDTPLFEDNKTATITLGLSYNFSNRYESYPKSKHYLPSPYPTLSLRYTKGIPDLLGSDVDYDLLTANLGKTDNT